MVATDLDGTILRADDTVSPRVHGALSAAARAGVRIVVATARPPRWIPVQVAALARDGLLVCVNGALVAQTSPWRVLEQTPLPAALARQVVSSVHAVRAHACFAVENVDDFGREPGFTGSRAPESAALVASAAELMSKPVLKMLVQDLELEDALLARIVRDAAGNAVLVTSSGLPHTVEIGPAGVSKASALRRICKRWGVPSHEVLAFGDMPNDSEMLAWAGWGVAVGEAHPELCCIADEIADGVQHDGVAVVLERVLAGVEA